MARAKTVQSIHAAATSVVAATPLRAAIDVRDKDGGIITIKMTNADPAPTLPASAFIMIAHDTGTLPATGAAGTVWKTVATIAGPTAVSEIVEDTYEFGPSVMHIQIEFSGNTVQNITAEAIASTVNYSA